MAPRGGAASALSWSTQPADQAALTAQGASVVYLLPEGYAAERLTHALGALGQLCSVSVDENVTGMVAQVNGRLGDELFTVEVRERSATVIAASFAIRRDLMLMIMECVEATGA